MEKRTIMLVAAVWMLMTQTYAWTLDAEDKATVVTEDNGVLTVEAPKGATLWYDTPMHGNTVIEYEARIVPDERFRDKHGNVRTSDLNCFWMADRTDPEGGSGRFVNNYALKMYYVGYGGNSNTTTRFRRYTGDSRGVTEAAYRPAVITEYTDSSHLLTPGKWYSVRLEQIDGRVRYLIDGKCLVDYLDPEPLTEGYFGFRTTLAKAQLRNFRHYKPGRTYYMATDGDDSADGSIDRPIATLMKAQELAQPGDTVYIRGGVYRFTTDDIAGVEGHLYNCLFIMDKDGEKGRRICYFGYPGERPVFDLDGVRPQRGRVSAFFVKGSYLHFRNFEIVGTHVVFSTRNTQSECISNRGGSHNIYECLSMHDGEAIGFYLTIGGDNLVLNCDAYRNWEVTETASGGGRGGNVDGFGAHPAPGGTGNVIRGCRAWYNSDDGFDLINASEAVTIEDCWAFYNGYKPDSEGGLVSLADGNGIKAGGYGMKPNPKCPPVIPMHRVLGCLAYGNKASGIYANHHLGGVEFVGNTSAANRYNYNMVCRKSVTEIVDVDGYGHRLADNVSYAPRDADIRAIDYDRCEVTNCTFYPPMQLADSDFVSLDSSLLLLPRNPDGSLPDIDFLKPAPTSEIITTSTSTPTECGCRGRRQLRF